LQDSFVTTVIAGHGMWKWRFHEAIETGRTDYILADVARDDRCALGKWLYGEGRGASGGWAGYGRIRELHASFHRAAAEVLELAVAGDKAAATERSGPRSKFARTSTELVQLLDALRPGDAGTRDRGAGADPMCDELVGASLEVTAQADVACLAAEDVSANVEAVATATEEMSATIREVAGTASRAAETAALAVTSAEDAAAMVRRLSQAATEINGVLGVITAIAAQTRLLSLNARIEAARAGEAGAGFAVVAGEVKELASQTAAAAGSVAEKLKEINLTVENALSGIATFTSTAREIHENETSIATAVEEQSTVTNEIAQRMAAAATAGLAITENVSAVALASRTMGSTAAALRASRTTRTR
jgi:methyl-accepting chemotaxis protein